MNKKTRKKKQNKKNSYIFKFFFIESNSTMFRRLVHQAQEMFAKRLRPASALPQTDGEIFQELNQALDTESERNDILDWSEFEGVFYSELLPKDGGSDKTTRFLLKLVYMLFDYIYKQSCRTNKVLDFHLPHQLLEMMDHCLHVDSEPRDLEQILSDCKETLRYCVRTGHPRFLNQLSSGLDIIGLAGEWLIATVNTNMFTYEVAPVFTIMESEVLERMRNIIGWENGDGIFSPGGAISNLYGVLTARHYACPDIKEKGLLGIKQIVLFASEQSHFSICRAASILGIGTENLIKISCDDRGKMNVAELETQVISVQKAGKLPFFVNATVGTTILGAFDPLPEIADVCERHKLWLHVDGAWGGSILMSKKHRHLLDGIYRANSFTWNPHKLLGVPLQCSAFLLREKGHLQSCNAMHADYLFQKDKNYDISYDTGDKAIQCGRHNDIFKFWLMWRAKGEKGFGDHIDRMFELGEYLRSLIKGREGFKFVLEKGECTNVCFWYIPARLRDMPEGHEKNAELHKVASRIKASMLESGTLMVGYQPMGKLPNFFRVVISNPAVMPSDLDFLVNEIDRLGQLL